MPISKDRFQDLSDDETGGPRPGTNAATILDFLRENPEKAFTQSDIAAATDVKTGSIGPTLVRLRERGRVDHRGTYWRVSDHDRSVEAATDHAGASLADRERDGETPSYDEWQAYAVDPREESDE
ncbi:MarR family transcriptional regulator [Halorhabdus sp. CBA1104]|uniref:MarR family transcriptional regulator n=1 Tax=unclassified Halorhabdus TaxID=2621901 RepID=UPI0012B286F5|nr:MULTISPECIES: MarR family transcriptional regulator [unclassified Halorhabdus]QGN07412.1 MarR family transcriptional regulator [Halorhabdus sp. CBA1104]